MLHFGTLGVANILPQALVHPCIDEPSADVVAIAARDRARADDYARHAHIRHVLDDYQSVIDHPDVNVVYVPLPISAHKEWTLKALAAGKPVLCEKSFALNAAQAAEMAAAAEASGLVVMDAFHYRYHPLFERARAIYASGVFGTIESIEAVFHIPVTGGADKGNLAMGRPSSAERPSHHCAAVTR